MDKFSFLGNSEIDYIDELYQSYKKDPNSVEETWRTFFQGFDFASANFPIKQESSENLPASESMSKEFNVMNLIQAYRQRGHLFTKTNPVRTRRKYFPTLDIENFDLAESDLETPFHAGKEIGIGIAKLKDIVSHLQETYCKSVGAEYVFVRHPQMLRWLQKKMESSKNTPQFTDEQRKHIYYHLKMAVGFENYIHKKFVGQKDSH